MVDISSMFEMDRIDDPEMEIEHYLAELSNVIIDKSISEDNDLIFGFNISNAVAVRMAELILTGLDLEADMRRENKKKL